MCQVVFFISRFAFDITCAIIKKVKNFVRFSSFRSLIDEGGDKVTDFEKIYRKHFSDVYRYLLKLSGDELTAEEITSETFFKALRSVNSFRGDCDIRVWLCQIAKNCYYTHLKNSSRFTDEDITETAITSTPSKSLSDEVQERDEALRIQKILSKIGDPYKEVFMWRVYAELSFKQIAQIYGKSENWACVTYHRARKMIKERLEAD